MSHRPFHNIPFGILLAFVASAAICSVGWAQPREPAVSKSSVTGFLIGVDNSGFKLGGYYRDSLTVANAFIAEFSFGTEKSTREVAFFDRFGRKSIPGKLNYLITIPVHLGWQRRLFRNAIEDNFRPFLQVALGPTIGWEYPYFEDCNNNGLFEPEVVCSAGTGIGAEEVEDRLGVFESLPKGTIRLGAGGSLGIGAFFGRSSHGPRGFRIGYTASYFLEGIQLLEIDIQRKPKHIFGSPTVTFYLGSVF